MGFIRQHALFGASAAAALLPSYFFMFGPMHIGFAFACRLDFVEQQAPGEEAVETLLPGALRLHLEPGWAMGDHDAGGSFVDVLAAVAAGAHKSFLQVRLLHAQFQHALSEVFGFIEADGELAHAPR